MTHWRDRLLDADRARARELSIRETERLRRAVVGEAVSATRRRRGSVPFALIAGALTAASAALVLSTVPASRGLTAAPDRLPTVGDAAQRRSPEGSGRQQLQFATPGGTRIIWVFDADFEVKGTLP